MTRARILFVVLAMVLSGCAPAATGEGASPRRSAAELHPADVEATRFGNAYEMVSSLRPQWLAQRGQQSLTDPTAGSVRVYLDGSALGGAEALRGLSVQDVRSMRYLSPSEAQARFGSRQNLGPAIVVTSVRAQ
jgi:hypothetical protein